MDGLLVIDKPAGWTSHDVVARVRRITGVRRVGHAGTLDPAATGVLPLGIGRGTRVLEYLGDADKSYIGTLRLGLTTTTDDAEGEPIQTRDWRGITEADVRAVLSRFVGDIAQVPPTFSAIKRAGVPLYRLARKGIAVRPEPRQVRIDRIDGLQIALPDLTIAVTCSKGTYIRSLARDIGEALGCGAHLTALRRTRHGPFTLAEALSLEALAPLAERGELAARLLPPDLTLLSAPVLIVGTASERRLLTGRSIRGERGAASGPRARVYAADGAFVAIARPDGHGGWLPDKVFAELG